MSEARRCSRSFPCSLTVDALRSYDRALAAKPDYAEAHFNRANALRQLGRSRDALVGYDKAIAIKSDYAKAHNNRGTVLEVLNRDDRALASYDRALVLRPDFAEAFNNRGNALRAPITWRLPSRHPLPNCRSST